MVINRPGTEFSADGKVFTVGGEVWVKESSDWNGLHGYVTEIRTDEDKDTENEGPDIYCDFEFPASKRMITELERRFSALYQVEKKVDDLPLDGVIMAPEELEPVALAVPEPSETLYTLTRWHMPENAEELPPATLGVSKSKDYLLKLMSDDIAEADMDIVLENALFHEDRMEFIYSELDFGFSDQLLHYDISPDPFYKRAGEVCA